MTVDVCYLQIRVEMIKERSQALKEQEEKLGALVAELQLSKAKEVSCLGFVLCITIKYEKNLKKEFGHLLTQLSCDFASNVF